MTRLGIDTGGTFTDFVWLDETGQFQIHKQISTPDDPSSAILGGLAQLPIAENAEVVHGSTVATNALLERRGARTALITTAGFADVLAIGRQNRPDLYALVPQKTAPLIADDWRFGVGERISASGELLEPLDLHTLNPILEQISRGEIESVAVSLLFSYLYPNHERQIRQAILDWFANNHAADSQIKGSCPHISLSSEILPEYREYERTATTVINAYVAPLMNRYLTRLVQELRPRKVAVMQSNGGIISAETAGRQAARTVLSGPAGGVVGARYIAELAGADDFITFDMGGTSTDVALCPGKLPTTSTGSIAGMPLRLPIIDIHTVGAGGGSLAMVDPGGALHVGPQSAGADPGPLCYGRTANRPTARQTDDPADFGVTTTDANLALGRLDSRYFLGGSMPLYEKPAVSALQRLASAIGVSSAAEAAWGVIQVANATMERAIRRITVERGFDPRLFSLVAFGGAGPLHACELAQELQIPRVLVPTVPGVLSALGMLVAAPTKDYSQTALRRVAHDDVLDELWMADQFSMLVTRAEEEMAYEGYPGDMITLMRSVDLRYDGQSHELTVPYRHGYLINDFHSAHEARYGYNRPLAAVEIVTIRLSAVARVGKPPISQGILKPATAQEALLGEKAIWFTGGFVNSRQYDRGKLHPGCQFGGPAAVHQYDTTTIIPPRWRASVDVYRNLILTQDLENEGSGHSGQ